MRGTLERVEVLALTLTVVVHLVGLATLVAVLLHNDDIDWRSWWPRDDDDGRGGPGAPPHPPLPDAARARARMREPARLGDAYPPRERRPAREPLRAPERAAH